MAFVKFSRGLTSIYNNLSRKDPDTLYLVYETQDATSGALYLGDKLISSVSSGSNSLASLTDVNISGELQDGMLLQYNASTGGGKWEAVSLSEIIFSSNTNFASDLNDITSPAEKDIAIIGSNAYIYHNNDWVQLTDSLLSDRISALEEKVGSAGNVDSGIAPTGLYKDIADTKTEVIEYISNLSHLVYEVFENVSDIDKTSENAATTIYLVPKGTIEENNGYDEYFVIDGELEKIGNLDVDLDDYVKTTDSRLLTASQAEKIDAITLDENKEIVIQASQVGGLNEAIQSAQLIKSVQSGTFLVTETGELQLQSIPSIDLSGYVKTEVFTSAVGDLSALNNRVSENSSLVDEINQIKTSIIWQEMTNEIE